MDGHELLGRIKNSHPQLPVLLMTAYGNIEKAVTAMRDGAVDYLAKPFEPQLLLEKVGESIVFPETIDEQVVAEDLRSRELLELARRVAQTDATVMIGGRQWDRQGGLCPFHSSPVPAKGRGFCRHQLRRHT